ncbi:MAG: carboxypeptidase regulatory-like domain-containing protein [Bryobacteraceae bacterium]|nr:carboxypeptidase regulatory-like domain-containing protein [Bryobacteraceae bacterium]MDW8379995.1 carboxypeptidase regulatory-like domain-containing protein [Bryobacterales bacterium]
MKHWLSVLALALSSLLRAQSPLGAVTGLAVDPGLSAVAQATVKLRSVDTGVEREFLTDATGAYTFPNLPPGRYRLTASAKGFRTIETEEFLVAAYRTVRQDLRFELAANVTEVTVTARVSAVVQTESPSISVGLSSKQILELPTNLRSVFNNAGDSGLIFSMMPLTVPGVVQVGAGAAWLAPGSGANGVRLKVDGIETNFGNFGGPDPVSQPSFESVEEFTANLNSNRAEFGGVANITTVTKAGSNQFHATAFWYVRNSAFDARNPFQAARPFQNIHNYGANLSGPLKKDKTFFLANFDGTSGSRAYLFNANVPTLAQREGDFSGAGSVRNPYNGQPFEGNRIPPSLISPQARRAQELFYPLPNFGPPTLTAGNYRASFNGPETHRIYELRLDHNFRSAQSAFVRYQHKNHDYKIPGARSPLPPTSVGTSTNLRNVHFLTLGHLVSLRPSLFNEFRAGNVVLSSKSDADVKGQALLDQIGIRGLPPRPGINGVPTIVVAGLSTVQQLLLNPVNDGHFQVSDNLTWTRGRHTVKGGFELVYWYVNRYMPVDAASFGNFNFSSRFSNHAYADFLLGLPTSVTRVDPYPAQYSRWNNLAWYVQDDFKVAPRLTLSYGLRWEYNQPVTVRDDNFYSFDPVNGNLITPSASAQRFFSPAFPRTVPVVTGDTLGLNRTLRQGDKNNFAPRFGFSYLAGQDAKMVIRGGWGVFYAPFSGAVTAFLAGGPYSLSSTINNAINNGVPLITFESPFGAPGAPGTLNLNGVHPRLRNSYVMQYNLSIERELIRDLGLRVSYIGSRGVQIPFQRNVNQPPPSLGPARRPFPAYNNLIWAENGAYNSYSGLQTQITHRFSRHLTLTSAWTWAKQISEVDDTGNADLNTMIENAYDRRRDRADVYAVPRHQWMNQVLYELPFAKTSRIFGGWQLNALVNLQTGNFLNPVFAGPDPSNTFNFGGRPDLVKEAISYPRTLTAWYDRSAFAIPQAGRFGNAGRNIVQGPGYVIANFGVAKNLRFERAGSLQLAASFQNALNHVNFGQPNMTVTAPQGGTITSSHIFPAAGSPRTGQLSLRWMF